MAFSNEQIREYIQSNNLDGRGIYDAAQKYGIDPRQVDESMGWNPGTSTNWINQNIPADTGVGGPHAGGSTTNASQTSMQAGGNITPIAPDKPLFTGNAPITPDVLPPVTGINVGNAPQAATAAQIQQPQQFNLGLGDAYQQMIYGDSAQNPYLQGALQRGVNQSNTAYGNMEDKATRNLLQNVLPQLRSQSIANNMMGSSRQGIAEGMALEDFTTGLQDARSAYGQDTLDATMQAQAGAYESGQNRAANAMQGLSGQQFAGGLANAQLQQQANLANLNAENARYGVDVNAAAGKYGTDASTLLGLYNTKANTGLGFYNADTKRYLGELGNNLGYYNTNQGSQDSRYGIDAQTGLGYYNADMRGTIAGNQLDSANQQWAANYDLQSNNQNFNQAYAADQLDWLKNSGLMSMYGTLATGTPGAPTDNGQYQSVVGGGVAGATTGLGIAKGINDVWGGGGSSGGGGWGA